jgi:glycosyltransferase involved in cell wall biosynthesis
MTSPRAAAPLVTVAIPLYESRRFLEIIAENIRNADYPNLEILVSDRHLADDTVEQLRGQFAGDQRLRFITAEDGLSWVDHYNTLLAAASGEYFLWMPHDDSYPPGYIGALVARLEGAPDSVLAFGYCDAEHPDGQHTIDSDLPPIVPGEVWSPRSALRLLFGWDLGVAMRGVFRRSAVADAGLWLPQTRGRAHADTCWLFGMALLGRFEFVPEARCLKRFYPTSTHAQWRPLPPIELTRVLTRYLRDLVPSPRERILGVSILWFGAVLNRGASIVNKVTRRNLISRFVTQRIVLRILRSRGGQPPVTDRPSS